MDYKLQAEFLARIIIAAICGGIIGYERKNRGKGAGLRTHIIVSLAASLMMIVSQFGFDGFLRYAANNMIEAKLDPSRAAAQIISGIGFLGAGMIFVQKRTVTGLTTAAGIWATAGIGMAIGGGMYFLGISCTIIILLIQIILHKNLKILQMPVEREFVFVMTDREDEIEKLLQTLEQFEIYAASVSFNRKENERIELHITAQLTHEVDEIKLMNTIYNNENIKSAKV